MTESGHWRTSGDFSPIYGIHNHPPGGALAQMQMNMNRSWTLAVIVLLATACGGTPTGSITTPSASPEPIATPSAAPTPVAGACNPCLALVTLRGSTAVVVRDITDIAHPKTIGSYAADSGPTFISATEVSYVTGVKEQTNGSVAGSLYRAPLAGSPKTLVTDHGGAGAWSPDGSAVLYMTLSSTDSYTATGTVHQLSGGHDQVLGSMPPGGGGDCQSIATCEIPNFLDFRLMYSPDGTHISLVTTGFGSSSFRVWASDGTVLTRNDDKGTTMSTWSGSTLYFRDSQGVQTWHDGMSSPFLPGVVWIRPQGSAAGGQIVYTVRDSSGWGHIRLVDTATRKVRELKSARTDAVFLTSRYIWYRGERACTPAEQCGSHPATHPENGKTYIYDLQDGSETESIITGVADVWPHAA